MSGLPAQSGTSDQSICCVHVVLMQFILHMFCVVLHYESMHRPDFVMTPLLVNTHALCHDFTSFDSM